MEKIYVIIKENVSGIMEPFKIIGYTDTEQKAKEIIENLYWNYSPDWIIYYYEEINKIDMV